MTAKFLSRRKFLALAGLAGTGLGLAARPEAGGHAHCDGWHGGRQPHPLGRRLRGDGQDAQGRGGYICGQRGERPHLLASASDAEGGRRREGVRDHVHTQPIIAKTGQSIRVRYMNEGLQIHPMHLHGLPQTVFAKDGWPLPQPYKCDTLVVGPGERWDVTVVCDEPGVWAFHCHILTHAESAHGMFGMVTALIIQ